MNINPGKMEFSEAEHDALVSDVRTVMTREKVSQADVAREADIPSSSLSQYLGGKYPNEKGKADIANALTRWLQTRAEAKKLRKRLPTPPVYIDLEGSEAIIDGFLLAVKKLDERHLGLDSHAPEKEPIVFRKGRGEVAHDAAV